MKHLGDITKISGYEIEPVDVITGGSPCQDLSVAGKRKGLAGERSGLFMEQMRIVKEMRDKDEYSGRSGKFIRPRYMVWENVPGAFSSGNPKGADFAAVIEEIIKVCERDAVVDVCVPNGGWPKSGCYYAEDGSWSIAWRVHDAQFWGVPQRRKRIALVADFGGLTAPEILFERKGLSGNFEQSGAQGERTARTSKRGAFAASFSAGQGGIDEVEPIPINTMLATRDKALGRGTGLGIGREGDAQFTISAAHSHAVLCLNDQGGSVMSVSEDVSGCLRAQEHGHQPAVYDARGNGDGETAPTMTGDHNGHISDYTALCCETYQSVTGPLMANSHPGSYTGQDAFSDMLVVQQEREREL